MLALLNQYIDYERKQTVGKCRTKSLFLRTCYEKIHWIGALLDDKNDGAIKSLDHKVYHHLRLYRLILKMGNCEYDNNSWCSELEETDSSVVQAESALELCYDEIKRQKIIFEFLATHEHFGKFDEKMLLKHHVMSSLLSLQVDFSMQNYEAIKKLLQMNNRSQNHQITITGKTWKSHSNEVDLFNEYMIVKLYLTMIQSDEVSQETIDANLQHIRGLLKTITDGKVLFRLMQNVFTLIFLRFEHIRKTKRKRKNSEIQSGSFSNQNNSQVTDTVSDTTVETLLHGFVCLRETLKVILNSMRLFLMSFDKSPVYKASHDDLKVKFGVLLKNVDNSLWRLRIIENDGGKKEKTQQSVKEWIRLHDVKTSNVTLEVTSDEENLVPKRTHRKKLKKRAKLAVKTDDNDEASDDLIEYVATQSSVTENSEHRTQSRSTESQRRVRSIIPKVLMNPESLIAMCLLKDDHENVQKLIQVSLSFT